MSYVVDSLYSFEYERLNLEESSLLLVHCITFLQYTSWWSNKKKLRSWDQPAELTLFISPA